MLQMSGHEKPNDTIALFLLEKEKGESLVFRWILSARH